MNIGLGQIDIIWEDKAQNMLQCSAMMADAAAKEVHFIVFPEMTLTGFTMNYEEFGEYLDASPTIDFFKQEANKNNLCVCFGMIVRNADKAENHCIIINSQGELVADYAKIHPFSYGHEAECYTGGESLAFCELQAATVSPLVCYDLRFPEVFQACSVKSTIITVIANWPSIRRCHWIALVKARAIENQCFIIAVNRAGTGDGITYSGDSMLVNPYGEIVTHSPDGPGLAFAYCDQAQAVQYRAEFPLKADRQPALYTRFYSECQELGNLKN